MAIFIASTKSISRSSGQSAVASASYRAGCELKDERYGKVHDYSKKNGVMSADIILPTALAAAKATIDRSDLWNKAESAEHRKDARVAREWLINLPHELDEQNRKELAHTFARTLADKYGTIADCAIHQPTQKEVDRGADPRNFHAHIMFTTRTAELDADNQIILTDKATIELSDTKRKTLGLERVSHEIKEVRQIWEHIANDKLAEHDHKLVDSRSYTAQGIDIVPQFKMGSVATRLERDKYEQELEKVGKAKEKGEVYEIDETPATIRGEINAMIAERNSLVVKASNRIVFEQRDYDERLERTERSIDRADQKIGLSERWIASNSKRASRSEQGIDDTSQNIEWSRKRCENLPKRINDTTQRIDGTASAYDKIIQRIDNTKQSIKKIVGAIEKSDIEINKAIERYTRPAPTPFDDNYRRAFHERKRRLDRELRDEERTAREAKFRVTSDSADLKEALSIYAHRLMTRHNEKFSLRPGFRENPNNYPEKFDYRQVKILDRLANDLGLTNNFSDFRDEQQRIAELFTIDVMKNNLNAIDILIDREKERLNYNDVTSDFDNFITRLDANRKIKNDELQSSLSRSEISRMTAETLTAKSYLEHIENYISKDSTADECKLLAEQRIKETLTRTSTQYQLSFEGLKTLSSIESAQKHAKALESSLSEFTTRYNEKLTDSDIKSINEGLKAVNQQVEVTRPVNRPSPF